MRASYKSALAFLSGLFLISDAQARIAGSTNPPPIDFTANLGLVSDYRFRGLTASGYDPALQGSIRAQHGSGAYVMAWASSLDESAGYGEVELDLVAGVLLPISSSTQIDVSGTYYLYPGADLSLPSDVAEVSARLIQKVGFAELAGGIAYAPEQNSLGGADNLYVFGDATIAVPNTPVVLKAHLGHTDGAWAPRGTYVDWSIVAEVTARRLTLGLGVVEASRGGLNGSTGVVASAFYAF